MNRHRYILEPYKGMNTRYHCPSCQQRNKTLSLYIDTETGEHLHPAVGRCNRESNCGHHYTPKQYFQDHNISFDSTQSKAYKPSPETSQQKPVSFIPLKIFKASLKSHDANHFVKFLINQFGFDVASELVSRYFIASSKHWSGATVFWQIDIKGNIRTGKIMLYSPTTGKRVKEPFNHISWVHKAIKQHEYELRQCLFGEHLLIDRIKPVAIVESEKTAVIASVYLPQFIWLATGSLTNLNVEKCDILKGRFVILFPDLNGFEKWSSKAKELSHFGKITVSDLLERKATQAERQKGYDLADYLIKEDWQLFRKRDIQAQPSQPNPVKVSKDIIAAQQVNVLIPRAVSSPKVERLKPKPFEKQPENWGNSVAELETYFASVKLPTHPIKLNRCSTISNCSKFLESHLAIIKANMGKRTFLPYLNRLQSLKKQIQQF